ncbi:MAG: hypothetical protein AAB474_02970, partial [Patescibacteria group bacterium]
MKSFSAKFIVSFLILTTVFYVFSFQISEAGGAVSVVNTAANFVQGVGEVIIGTATNDTNLTDSGRCRLGISTSPCPGGSGSATSEPGGGSGGGGGGATSGLGGGGIGGSDGSSGGNGSGSGIGGSGGVGGGGFSTSCG